MIINDIVQGVIRDMHRNVFRELWLTPTDIPASEAAALKAFYDATGGPDWTANTGWGTAATADDWYGVTVTDGHVTMLSGIQFSTDISGGLPADIKAATEALFLAISVDPATAREVELPVWEIVDSSGAVLFSSTVTYDSEGIATVKTYTNVDGILVEDV